MINQDSACLLYQDIVGAKAKAPWYVTEVLKDEIAGRIIVRIEYDPEITTACPVCAQRTKLYDHRIRKPQYLDTCQYETVLEVHVPRIKCEKDGVQQIPIPFAEKRSRFSFRFESVVLELLRSCPISRTAEHLRLSWDETAGIMGRAVQRGLERRRQIKPRAIGIDETPNGKRHDYVTVILDKDRDSVIDVLTDRWAETLENWLKNQKTCDFSALESMEETAGADKPLPDTGNDSGRKGHPQLFLGNP
jgi:transposase